MRRLTPYFYSTVAKPRQMAQVATTNYRRHRPQLRIEFGRQCVYCRDVDRSESDNSFGIDHYRPKALFPQLVAEYGNLFYCCNRCNLHKNKYWPTPSELKAGYFIPNPADHVMSDHARFVNGQVTARSPAGHVLEQTLDLNHPDKIAYRRVVRSTLGALLAKLRSFRQKQRLLRRKLAVLSPAVDPDTVEALQRIESEVAELYTAFDVLAAIRPKQ